MNPTHNQSSCRLSLNSGLYHLRFLVMEGAGVVEDDVDDIEVEAREKEEVAVEVLCGCSYRWKPASRALAEG